MKSKLIVKSNSFSDNGLMNKRNTGFGEDISPDFTINNLPENTETIAIIMYDLNIPIVSPYCHWLIWNLPPINVINENTPHGEILPTLSDAVQGNGYGKHRYKGPKQPFFVRSEHKYEFNFYALDTKLELDASSSAKELLPAMEGHILAQGKITGRYKR